MNRSLRTPSAEHSDWSELVREKVNSLQYGVVQIVVQDSRVTQIERTERVRLPQPPVGDE